jgi:hypothetical protein
MAGKFPSLGDFDIPTIIFDTHEWVADEFIDGEIGQNCTLVYPDKYTECSNCKIDPSTGRSSNKYKAGGPAAFTSGLCPLCFGVGRLQERVTETIRMRVYFDSASWKPLGIHVADPNGVVVCIGYFSELYKLERATKVLLCNELEGPRRYEYIRQGEAIPHGFRRNRYFIQIFKRASGG